MAEVDAYTTVLIRRSIYVYICIYVTNDITCFVLIKRNSKLKLLYGDISK